MGLSLIIGRHDDPHTQSVSRALEALGGKVKCIDSFRSDAMQINFNNGDKGTPLLKFLNSSGNEIRSIWLRQKPVIPMAWWSPLQHDAARFAQGEWRTIIQSLEAFLPNVYWINSPEAQSQINYKPKQLNLASSLGFTIPDTIITNDPKAVSDLIKIHGKIIYKSLSGYVFTDQTGILTSIVTEENLKTNIESVGKAPGIYQQFVEKAYEARVTVVGERIFAAFIQTPKTGPGAVDWRHAHFEDIFKKGDVPLEVIKNIKEFQTAARIKYGAYDFVISPKGIWYFLECNPAGQFLWLEHALGYKISHAIAEDLFYCKSGSFCN